MLHITDGSAANRRLRRAGIRGDFLAWDDPLHHGPVPGGLSLSELTEIRAAFIAENGWQPLDQARLRLVQRNRALEQAATRGEAIIWSSFELFDQLHLLQLMDWFEQHRQVLEPPRLIFVDDHLGGGQTDDEELQQLLIDSTPASQPLQGTAAAIWQAFTAAQPTKLLGWFEQKTPDLPFMHNAMERLLDEYPGFGDGLSRSERQIIEVLELGPLSLPNLFQTAQALEPVPFMGDWSFWVELRRLVFAEQPAVKIDGEPPLLLPPKVEPSDERFRRQRVSLTPFGQQLLEREVDFLAANRSDRWVGGVELNHGTAWRWDRYRHCLVDLMGQPLGTEDRGSSVA